MQRTLIYLLYRLIQAVAFPLILAYLLLRGFRDRNYFQHLNDRFGWLPHSFQGTAHGAIWLHAVSVGEVMTSLGLLEQLRKQYPSRRIFVSSSTLAGRALAEEKLAGLVDGVLYAPIDYCFAVRGVLRCLRPSVVVVLETEIWPNLYREVKRTGAALIVVNGRISDRAMPRNRRVRWLFAAALSWPDLVLAQSDVAAQRYRELGAPAGKVRIAGNLKYDFDPSGTPAPPVVRKLVEEVRPEAVWIAASTMPPREAGDVDEDDVALAAFQQLAARRAAKQNSSVSGAVVASGQRPEDFVQLDTNYNGQIEMHEFATEFDASVVSEFYQRDASHDGVITLKEWNRFLADTKPMCLL